MQERKLLGYLYTLNFNVMNFKNISISSSKSIRTIYISREKQLNALNTQTLEELSVCLGQFLEDEEVRGLIITGEGKKSFVAGADIKEFAQFSSNEAEELSGKGIKTVFDIIYNYPKPIIAAVNGYCLGGGLELALACHIRIGSNNALLGLPEVSLGLIPGYGGTQRLPALIGRGRALEMILSGKPITSEQAYEWGLINHLVVQEDLLDKAQKLAESFSDNSPLAQAHAIAAVNRGLLDPCKGQEEEIKRFGACFQTSDFKEGVGAFLEKRKPDFNNL